ncbi:hypothetical protein CY0110_17662 [Crocosphaera chwakensis CCY0110]|uniref:Uncharacterized protein n=1 Tax=Crocosphaera chwakensis CCY0110 TaxID=391612 RepID=A3IIL4_9CHRO|nr:hypothetical protein CY0110_17662 [Crocosphaera chwakensis CCY0110]
MGFMSNPTTNQWIFINPIKPLMKVQL